MTWTRQQRDKHRGTCPYCSVPVDKAQDIQDCRTGLWWHELCFLWVEGEHNCQGCGEPVPSLYDARDEHGRWHIDCYLKVQ